jgi:hypothetical protein
MRLTQQQILIKFAERHGDRYNYSKVVYKDCKTPIIVICPDHGEFSINPSEHGRGAGCYQCKSVNMAASRMGISLEEYKKARKNGNGFCKTHGFIKYSGSHCVQCRNLATNIIHQRNKLSVLNWYSKGTMVCNHCGEGQLEFMALDHIYGAGAKHKREVGTGGIYWAWFVKNNFPDGYQVLCHSCNWLKYIDGLPLPKYPGMKARQLKLKTEAIKAYGGRCVCCGEIRLSVLTIDHIAGNGSTHRKENKTSIYNWLKKECYPPGHQILCVNCNDEQRQWQEQAEMARQQSSKNESESIRKISLSESDRVELIKDYESGMTQSDTGKKWGVCIYTVRAITKKAGIKARDYSEAALLCRSAKPSHAI